MVLAKRRMTAAQRRPQVATEEERMEEERQMETWMEREDRGWKRTSCSTQLILYTTSAEDFENCPEVACVVEKIAKRVVKRKEDDDKRK